MSIDGLHSETVVDSGKPFRQVLAFDENRIIISGIVTSVYGEPGGEPRPRRYFILGSDKVEVPVAQGVGAFAGTKKREKISREAPVWNVLEIPL